MPRVYARNSDPLDFCCKCFPDEDRAWERYGSPEVLPVGLDLLALRLRQDGPDGRGNCFGWDSPHPDYEVEEYTCDDCGRPLKALDN